MLVTLALPSKNSTHDAVQMLPNPRYLSYSNPNRGAYYWKARERDTRTHKVISFKIQVFSATVHSYKHWFSDFYSKGKNGGVRPGAGQKKAPHSIEAEAARKLIVERVTANLTPLLNAQVSLATGQQFLYKIEKTWIEGPRGRVTYRNEKPEIVTS